MHRLLLSAAFALVVLTVAGCEAKSRPASQTLPPGHPDPTSMTAPTPQSAAPAVPNLTWTMDSGWLPVRSKYSFAEAALSGDGKVVYTNYPAAFDAVTGKLLWEGTDPKTRFSGHYKDELVLTVCTDAGIFTFYQDDRRDQTGAVRVFKEYPGPARELGRVAGYSSVETVDPQGRFVYLRRGIKFTDQEGVDYARVALREDGLSSPTAYHLDRATARDTRILLDGSESVVIVASDIGRMVVGPFDGNRAQTIDLASPPAWLAADLGANERITHLEFIRFERGGRFAILRRETEASQPGNRDLQPARDELVMVDVHLQRVAWSRPEGDLPRPGLAYNSWFISSDGWLAYSATMNLDQPVTQFLVAPDGTNAGKTTQSVVYYDQPARDCMLGRGPDGTISPQGSLGSAWYFVDVHGGKLREYLLSEADGRLTSENISVDAWTGPALYFYDISSDRSRVLIGGSGFIGMLEVPQ